MRQAIRAVSWAIYLFWIILIFFTATVAYSAYQTGEGIGFDEPYNRFFNNVVTASLPFHLNNKGFYDIANLNLTTSISDSAGLPVSDSSTIILLVPHGTRISLTHNITLNMSQIPSETLSDLLFLDSNLTVETALKMDYAKAIPLQASYNFTMPWGAPLSHLTLGTISQSGAQATVPVSFENHSLFPVNGTMLIEIVDNLNQVIGQASTGTIVQPQGRFVGSVSVPLSGNLADASTARLYFDTSVFDYGPVVMPIV